MVKKTNEEYIKKLDDKLVTEVRTLIAEYSKKISKKTKMDEQRALGMTLVLVSTGILSGLTSEDKRLVINKTKEYYNLDKDLEIKGYTG